MAPNVPSETDRLVAESKYHGRTTTQATSSQNNDTAEDPWVQYERKRQQRFCLGLFLMCSVFGLVSAIAIGRAVQKSGPSMNVYYNSNALVSLKAPSSISPSDGTCEATLLVMRHCEKYGPGVTDQDGNGHCSYVGYERAHYLATLFGKTKASAADTTRWPLPSHLFALTTKRHGHSNSRELETLSPLAKKAGVEVKLMDGNKDLVSEYHKLLSSGSLCGKVSVVSWKHELLPGLAFDLGCGKLQGCPGVYSEFEYDQVWQLKFVYEPPPVFKAAKEEEPTNKTASSSSKTNDDPKRRQLKKKFVSSVASSAPKAQWTVYGTTVNQNFDPLAHSKLVGDYDAKGPTVSQWRLQGEL